MFHPALIALRFLGFAAVGFALGASWKLGTYLVEEMMRSSESLQATDPAGSGEKPPEDPLWRRKFEKISQE